MTEQNKPTPWEREVIEKLLLQNKQPKKFKKKFWIILLLVIIVVYFLFSFFSSSLTDNNREPHVAIIDLTEVISDENNTAEKLIQGLQDAYDNSTFVKGIIIRANSPGGSPVVSDNAFEEIKKLKNKYPEIPIYVVIEDMCASGCYYIAAAANKIFANKSSVVGSIGVIMMDLDLTHLADKIGIKDRTKTAGRNKAMGSPFQVETAEQKKIFYEMLDDMHLVFINAIKEGRGDRLHWQQNEDIFTGRVYSGIKAKEVGLIDDFGSIYTVSNDVIKVTKRVNYTIKENLITFLERSFNISLKTSIETILKSFLEIK